MGMIEIVVQIACLVSWPYPKMENNFPYKSAILDLTRSVKKCCLGNGRD